MARQVEKWWITLLAAIVPSLVAGWFSLRAIDKANASAAQADKTTSELTVAYDLMKQALTVVQHEADADREALQKNNELLVKLLEQHQQHSSEEAKMLSEARDFNTRYFGAPPVKRPEFPANLHDLLLSEKK
jgi:hypothetical protein